MEGFLGDAYLWVKSVHIMFVIFWMAGMYYLPRLYVYHTEVEPGSELSENYKKMEVLLLRRIINPAMGAAWILGLLMVCLMWDAYSSDRWFWVKAAAVIAMSGYHGELSRWRKLFERDERPFTSRTLRILNEVPPLLTIVIVLMVIVKPF